MGIRRLWRPAKHGGQSISGSVVFGDVVMVQGVRGDVTISLDRPPYRVAEATVRAVPLSAADARAQPSRMLLARHRIVPFTGRDGMLSDLAEWLAGEAPLAVRLIHAPGGQGKTRLAGEVADRCVTDGWTVWRVLHTPTPLPGSRVDLPGGPVLAVVDYADRWPPSALLTLITQLQQLSAATSPVVRVLLLARSAGYWWPALADRVESDLTVPSADLALPSLSADRVTLYTAAAARFAAVLGPGDTVRPPGPGDDRLAADDDAVWPLPPGLGDDRFGQVLAVHMAALAAVDARRHGDDTPAGPEAVSAYLLRREAAHWHHLHARAENPLVTPPKVMHRTVWTATLTGALARPDAREALRQAGLDGGDRLIDDHRACYPSADSRTVLEPLHPDRLGEDLIALSVPGHDRGGGLTDDWTLTAAPLLTGAREEAGPGEGAPWSGAALTVLVETSRRWPHVATELLYPLIRQRPELAIEAGGATLTRLAGIPGIDPAVLEPIEDLLPPHRHIDLDVAAAAISTILTERRLAANADPVARARLLSAHAMMLSNAGQRDASLRAAKAAAAMFRRLDATQPGRYRPELVDALVSVMSALMDLSRFAQALRVAEEAITLQRRLAEDGAVENRTKLAIVLNNLAVVLAQRGQDGREAAEEAVSIYRDLVVGGAVELRPALANCLTSLSLALLRMGSRVAALTAVGEAVAIQRRLVGADPAVYLPDLAASLINQGTLYATTGRRDEALLVTEEAVDLYRRLVRANPDAFEPDLALALSNATSWFAELGRLEKAMVFGADAVQLLRRLALTDPVAFQQNLAMSLTNVGMTLVRLGRAGEALPSLVESGELFRRLAEAEPLAHLPNLSNALSHLSLALGDEGRFAEALAAAEEGIGIDRRLAAANPEAYEHLLARSLINLTLARHNAGALIEALEPGEEAVTLLRRLSAGNPAAHLPHLALSLNNLGMYLWKAGRTEEALPLGEEAVRLRRHQATADPDAHLPDLAMSLINVGNYLAELGRLDEALAVSEECLRLYRRLSGMNPAAYQFRLAATLTNRGVLFIRAGRVPEALAVTEESTVLWRRLAAVNPAVHLADLADSLINLALWQALSVPGPDTLPTVEEAVGILRDVAVANPVLYRARLARALGVHARASLRTGAPLRPALASAEESVRLFTESARDLPEVYTEDVAISERVLGEVRERLAEGR
ncbi:tetratricopeptide (TPR) repeat protein [Actinoplanes campanulatus]|uniref:Tetratricopeptide (TPR) repeat protein n=1 Tax=Actinoplanes campanulatus TaxID=113559 RepID=A0A7W5AFE7_9ACTN|nr:tetratricopeptide repeat protein [Actinoplanes campanulatus]MBB3095308.1 tetratricopeptide (TPR) repeat protein [Actinoplanes campanulatus]